ncbi:hypothetical protein P3T76_000416 [Phytophthora citrophthora]|uniref:Uncharacterized protein n=1 Tax=Phytophthora citrophthora TaxID=4793 RepID=A0AAD9LTI9_9STRA|nr:hypothetical protein P3T76_000416 [Phytophthora citrophthora]
MNMGKVSVTQMPHDVPGNASREVFQGLFKDLGKQAMALEAILRAVCGRVDKMENWLTEVSFGMTELDQKLRNIAHNIDGTAAVDDEAQGPHRWAMPTTDDVKPLAPTVSKKLGADKKTVRVTGMAAAILDRLATTSASTPVQVVETEKSEKNITKKKSKEKKHGAKKVKANGLPDVPATPSPAVIEVVPPPAIPLPAPVVEAKPTPVQNVEAVKSSMTSDKVSEAQVLPVEQKKQEEVQASEVPVVERTLTPMNQESAINDEADLSQESVEMEPEISVQPALSQIDQTKEILLNPPPIDTEPKEKWSAPTRSITSILPTVQVEQTTQPFVLKGSAKPTPVVTTPISSPLVPTATIPDPQPVQLPVSTDPPTMTDEAPMPETFQSTQLENSPHESSPTISPRDTNEPDETLPQAATVLEVHEPHLPSSSRTNSTTKESTMKETEQLRPITEPLLHPESQSARPVLPVVTPTITPPPDLPTTVPTEIIPVKQASPPLLNNQPITVAEPTTVIHKMIRTDGAPIRAKAAPQHKVPLSPQSSEAAESAVDPLLPHRSSVHRRSSKMIQRPSFTKKTEHGADNDAAHRLSVRMRGSNSRRASLVPQVVEHETNPSPEAVHLPAQEPSQPQKPVQTAPVVQSIPQTPVLSSVDSPVDSIEQEESSENGSESSSGGSEASSGDEEQEEEDEEARAAVEEISKTMTALNKLKRAQMLSPEEEHELKERAHKKWYQLKGHIKEKQKKDVTNILLKRKKNVFTVSSRIELLEEKSREIFAALKQITHDIREKNDRSAHETLRRRVADIEQSLLSIDSRIASLSAPAVEKVSDLENEVVSLRSAVQLQLTVAQSEAAARHSLLEEALASQRALIEAMAQDVPAQLNSQAELFLEKLKQQPDYNAAIENLKRSLRRKADLKLLKELEARLLGLDAENEDCLVRCLSCHKEVTHPYNEDAQDDEPESNGSGSQLRKVNPGPSSARIYRSNVPFNAQVLVQESILEESSADAVFSLQQLFTSPQPLQHQSAGDSYASEKAPVVRVPNVKLSIPAAEINLKKVLKTPQASPLSLMNVTATRAIFSPDRPISAPVIAPRKKSAATRTKSLLKSLTSQPEPSQ